MPLTSNGDGHYSTPNIYRGACQLVYSHTWKINEDSQHSPVHTVVAACVLYLNA